MKEAVQQQVIFVDLVGFLAFLRVFERVREKDLRDSAVLGVKTSPCLGIELDRKCLQSHISFTARVALGFLNCLLEG